MFTSEQNSNLGNVPENPTFLYGNRTNIISNALVGHTYAILDVAHGGSFEIEISDGAKLIKKSNSLQSAADNGYYNVAGIILCIATKETITLKPFVHGKIYQNVIALDLGTIYQ